MPSDISIANAALRMIGEDRIESFASGDEAGRILDDIYEDKVRYALRLHPWNFAIKRESLYQTTPTPEYEFSYGYRLPDDCLRVLETSEDVLSGSRDWQVEGRTIVTSIGPPLKIKYIARVSEENFEPAFAEYVSALLATELAEPITGNGEVIDRVNRKLEPKFRLAKSNDGQEGTPQRLRQGTWVDAHAGYYGYMIRPGEYET